MPIAQAIAIDLVEQQQSVLQPITHRPTPPQRLVQRAQKLLLALKGLKHTKISQPVYLHRHRVRHWRRRWQDENERLALVESSGGSDTALSQPILACSAMSCAAVRPPSQDLRKGHLDRRVLELLFQVIRQHPVLDGECQEFCVSLI